MSKPERPPVNILDLTVIDADTRVLAGLVNDLKAEVRRLTLELVESTRLRSLAEYTLKQLRGAKGVIG